jgi:hypothetical protein
VIHFLSGALTCSYVVAAIYFFQFWRRAGDRLFLMFALAFGLLAINQLTLFAIGSADELGNYAYLLRVLAFALILCGIVAKNVARDNPNNSR